MSTPTITDVLAEIQRAMEQMPAGQDGATTAELATMGAVSQEKVRAWVRAMLDSGRMEVARAHRKAMDGTFRPVPVYRLVPPASKSKRA
jgi:hypothetical protein